MFVHGTRKLLVRLNERLHRIIIRTWILSNHVRLNTSACTLTAVRELAEEFVREDFGGRCGLYNL